MVAAAIALKCIGSLLRDIFVGRSSVDRFLHGCGLTLKKVAACGGNSNDQISRRARHLACQPVEARSCSVDLYRRDLGDDDYAPSIRWRSVCPALGRIGPALPLEDIHLRTGLRTTGFTAPLVIDGAINGTTFRAYVEQVLDCLT